jgi:hypothetical protein
MPPGNSGWLARCGQPLSIGISKSGVASEDRRRSDGRCASAFSFVKHDESSSQKYAGITLQ